MLLGLGRNWIDAIVKFCFFGPIEFQIFKLEVRWSFVDTIVRVKANRNKKLNRAQSYKKI
jgi:hypothetical protein